MLQIFDSLTRTKVPFQPINKGKVSLYVCGNTVYDDCHLGHARSMICFDMIVRFLRSQGLQVTYVRNITDIDDKIIQRASERQITIKELTNFYIQAQNSDIEALSILSPNYEPRATEYIPEIINLIQILINKNYAYVTKQGDVCFRVASFKDYGKLSHKDIEGLVAGTRVEVDASKDSPLDFVLWKSSKPEEPAWDSPWGSGRPGWHIECSAMALDSLGDTFDIHGGGCDLQFPHHENEIAQSEAATDKPFANYWMHVGMLQVNSEKMAKSKGNFFTIKSVLDKYSLEVIRYFLLSSHYRSDLNYSQDNLDNASKALTRLYQSLNNINISTNNKNIIDSKYEQKFVEAMEDDFNTPEAFAVLFDLCREINKTKAVNLAYTLKQLANRIGLLCVNPELFLQAQNSELNTVAIEKLIAERNDAREQRHWDEADKIRKNLFEQGIELEDLATGTRWRYTKRS